LGGSRRSWRLKGGVGGTGVRGRRLGMVGGKGKEVGNGWG